MSTAIAPVSGTSAPPASADLERKSYSRGKQEAICRLMAHTVKRIFPDARSVRIYFALVVEGAAVAVRHRVVALS
jgi:hypothetical protein